MEKQANQELSQATARFEEMVKKLKHELPPDTILLGTTTLRRMLNAVYDKNDPLYGRYAYSECGGAKLRLKDHPEAGDEVVYVYYHEEKNVTIMTNIEWDVVGALGSHAGFKGKVEQHFLQDATQQKSKTPKTKI